MEKVPQTQYCLHFKGSRGCRADSQDAAAVIQRAPVPHRARSDGPHKKEKKNTLCVHVGIQDPSRSHIKIIPGVMDI